MHGVHPQGRRSRRPDHARWLSARAADDRVGPLATPPQLILSGPRPPPLVGPPAPPPATPFTPPTYVTPDQLAQMQAQLDAEAAMLAGRAQMLGTITNAALDQFNALMAGAAKDQMEAFLQQLIQMRKDLDAQMQKLQQFTDWLNTLPVQPFPTPTPGPGSLFV